MRRKLKTLVSLMTFRLPANLKLIPFAVGAVFLFGCQSIRHPGSHFWSHTSNTACTSSEADVQWLNQLPKGAEDIKIWLKTLPHAGRQSDSQITLNSKRKHDITEILRGIWANDTQRIARITRSGGFSVTTGEMGKKKVLLIQEMPMAGIHAVALINLLPEQDIVVEIPHGTFEPGTLDQGLELFERAGARAMIVAGADRCASKIASGCDGKTTVCNNSPEVAAEPYVNSDVAHDVNNAFHIMHQEMASNWPQSRFIQFHGMKSGPTWVILSDGSVGNSAGSIPWSNRVRDILRVKLGNQPSKVTSCQSTDDAKNYNFRRLCGIDNVQGRSLNLSPEACNSSADSASGRFLHVEQTWDILGDASQRKNVVDAIVETLPKTIRCETSKPLMISADIRDVSGRPDHQNYHCH